jgi:hypothetical protein
MEAMYRGTVRNYVVVIFRGNFFYRVRFYFYKVNFDAESQL